MAKKEDDPRYSASRPSGGSKKPPQPASRTPKSANETPARSNTLLFVILGVVAGGGLLTCCGVGAIILAFWGMRPPANRPEVAVGELRIEADEKKAIPWQDADKKPAPKVNDAKIVAHPGGELTLPLPGPPRDVAAGAGGRFLIMHIPSVHQIVTFDVEKQQLTQFVELKEDVIHFAANANKLLIIYPFAKQMHTLGLNSNQDAVVTPLPAALAMNPIHQVCMGSASDGPLFAYIAKEKRTLFLDLASLATTEVVWNHWSPRSAYGHW